ncbi:transposase [Acidithiobacillus sp. MC6.1]|nr:transposase [Acidithiobacillus sp. MC6.1]
METTGVYGRDLAHFLVQQRLLVSVVNPAQIHAFGRTELNRAKTDKADARLIARYCQMRRPAPWAPLAAWKLSFAVRIHSASGTITPQIGATSSIVFWLHKSNNHIFNKMPITRNMACFLQGNYVYQEEMAW